MLRRVATSAVTRFASGSHRGIASSASARGWWSGSDGDDHLGAKGADGASTGELVVDVTERVGETISGDAAVAAAEEAWEKSERDGFDVNDANAREARRAAREERYLRRMRDMNLDGKEVPSPAVTDDDESDEGSSDSDDSEALVRALLTCLTLDLECSYTRVESHLLDRMTSM